MIKRFNLRKEGEDLGLTPSEHKVEDQIGLNPSGLYWKDRPKDLENTSRKFPLNKKYPLMPKSMKIVTRRFPISTMPQVHMIVKQIIPEGMLT